MVLNKLAVAFVTALVFLTGCSSGSLTIEKAEKESAVVIKTGPGQSANTEKMEQFYQDVQNHVFAELRIIRYTDEGDPIYVDLNSDGQEIQYSYDNSEDQFGGRDKGKKSTVCKQIIKRTDSRGDTSGTEYDLKDCIDDIGYSDATNKEYFLLFIEDKK